MQKAWVKETFGLIDGQEIVYRATDTTWDEASTKDHPMMIWKPSIFMRRVDSRITLEIEQVRVERLQDISEEDAKAEGCDYPAHGPSRCYRSAFNELWDSISAKKHPWASNPFVWVITFKL